MVYIYCVLDILSCLLLRFPFTFLLLIILQLIYQKSLEKSKRMLNQARKEEEGSNNLLFARHDGFMKRDFLRIWTVVLFPDLMITSSDSYDENGLNVEVLKSQFLIFGSFEYYRI